MAVTEMVTTPTADTGEAMADRLMACRETVERVQQYARQVSMASVRGCQAARAEAYQQMRDAMQNLLALADQGLRDLALLSVVDDNLAGKHAVDGLWHGDEDVRRWCELYLKDTAGGAHE